MSAARPVEQPSSVVAVAGGVDSSGTQRFAVDVRPSFVAAAVAAAEFAAAADVELEALAVAAGLAVLEVVHSAGLSPVGASSAESVANPVATAVAGAVVAAPLDSVVESIADEAPAVQPDLARSDFAF